MAGGGGSLAAWGRAWRGAGGELWGQTGRVHVAGPRMDHLLLQSVTALHAAGSPLTFVLRTRPFNVRLAFSTHRRGLSARWKPWFPSTISLHMSRSYSLNSFLETDQLSTQKSYTSGRSVRKPTDFFFFFGLSSLFPPSSSRLTAK